MSDSRLILGMRKGLLVLERENGTWKLVKEYLPGIPFSYGMVDHRSGCFGAAPNTVTLG